MTADALGRPVIVGPFEATAAGNALTQALGRGDVKDLSHLRGIVRASFDLTTYQPQDAASFQSQMPRFRALLGK
jgi:rhamnulokinase